MYKKSKLFILCLVILSLSVNMSVNKKIVFANEESYQQETIGNTEEQAEIDEDNESAEVVEEQTEKDENSEATESVEEQSENDADIESAQDAEEEIENVEGSEAVEDTEEGIPNDGEAVEEAEDTEGVTSDEDVEAVEDTEEVISDEDAETVEEVTSDKNADEQTESDEGTDADNTEQSDELIEDEAENSDELATEESLQITPFSTIEGIATIDKIGGNYVSNGTQDFEFVVTLTNDCGLIFDLVNADQPYLNIQQWGIWRFHSQQFPTFTVSEDGKSLTVKYSQVELTGIQYDSRLTFSIPNSFIKYDPSIENPPAGDPIVGLTLDLELQPTEPSMPSMGSIRGEGKEYYHLYLTPGKDNTFNLDNLTVEMFDIYVDGEKGDAFKIYKDSLKIEKISPTLIIIYFEIEATDIVYESDGCKMNIAIAGGAFTGGSDILISSSNNITAQGVLSDKPTVLTTQITTEPNTNKKYTVPFTLPDGFTFSDQGPQGRSWIEGFTTYQNTFTFDNTTFSDDKKTMTIEMGFVFGSEQGEGYFVFEVSSFSLLYNDEVSTKSLQLKLPIKIQSKTTIDTGATGGTSETPTDSSDTPAEKDKGNSAETPNPQGSGNKEDIPIVVDNTISKAKINHDEKTGVYEIAFNPAAAKELVEDLSLSLDPTNLNINLRSINNAAQNEQPKFDIVLPIKALKAADELKSITVNTEKVKLDFPMNALESSKNSANVTISIEEPKTLPSLYSKAVSGGRPAVSFNAMVGNKPADLKNNPANLSIRYDYSSKDIMMNLKIGVVFLAADGSMSVVESTYNQDTGLFDFAADKAGTYFIGNIGSLK